MNIIQTAPADFEKNPEYELKFVFPFHARPRVEAFLAGALVPELDHPCTTNYTLSYDSLEMLSLEEKLDSSTAKTKVRLRWYSDSSRENFSDSVFFEIKRKYNMRRTKDRSALPLDAKQLTGQLRKSPFSLFDPLQQLNGANRPALSFSERRFPILFCSYIRRRYLSPSGPWRINLDHGLEIENCSGPFTLAPSLPILARPPVIVEVKGTEPTVPRELIGLLSGYPRSSFSKYGYLASLMLERNKMEVL